MMEEHLKYKRNSKIALWDEQSAHKKDDITRAILKRGESKRSSSTNEELIKQTLHLFEKIKSDKNRSSVSCIANNFQQECSDDSNNSSICSDDLVQEHEVWDNSALTLNGFSDLGELNVCQLFKLRSFTFTTKGVTSLPPNSIILKNFVNLQKTSSEMMKKKHKQRMRRLLKEEASQSEVKIDYLKVFQRDQTCIQPNISQTEGYLKFHEHFYQYARAEQLKKRINKFSRYSEANLAPLNQRKYQEIAVNNGAELIKKQFLEEQSEPQLHISRVSQTNLDPSNSQFLEIKNPSIYSNSPQSRKQSDSKINLNLMDISKKSSSSMDVSIINAIKPNIIQQSSQGSLNNIMRIDLHQKYLATSKYYQRSPLFANVNEQSINQSKNSISQLNSALTDHKLNNSSLNYSRSILPNIYGSSSFGSMIRSQNNLEAEQNEYHKHTSSTSPLKTSQFRQKSQLDQLSSQLDNFEKNGRNNRTETHSPRSPSAFLKSPLKLQLKSSSSQITNNNSEGNYLPKINSFLPTNVGTVDTKSIYTNKMQKIDSLTTPSKQGSMQLFFCKDNKQTMYEKSLQTVEAIRDPRNLSPS